jgi:hypothetical protein
MMIWVFFSNGEIKESNTDPGKDCVKIKCATFREKNYARVILQDPLRREKILRKQAMGIEAS